MIRTSRKQRLTMLAVSAALVGGGALLPTSAFAATASHTNEMTNVAGSQFDHGKGDHDGKGKKNNKRGKKKNKGNRPRDVENMPGCKFFKNKVYCEHKPQPNPAPEPAPAPGTPPAPGTDTKPPGTGTDTKPPAGTDTPPAPGTKTPPGTGTDAPPAPTPAPAEGKH
ncbi:hypothetical protein [Streptomyces sp. 147326]|uniref:hypothetical protein n=1 Tax=Streptomyces sp. 147326 TaxID=3074379 RepID=UPI003857289A